MKKLLLSIALLSFIVIPTKNLLADEEYGYCDFKYRTTVSNESSSDCRILNKTNCEKNSYYCQWKTSADNQNNIFQTGKISPTDKDKGSNTSLRGQLKTSDISFIPQVNIPNVMTPFIFKEKSTKPIAELVKNLLNYGVGLIGLISLIVIIFGGFLWSTSSGSGAQVNEAKQWLFSGLSGLFLILFSYTLLSTINPNLVNLQISKIKTIERKDVKLINKSKKNQVEDDCSQFDGYYASSGNHGVENKPYHSGCCLVYIKNAAKTPENGVGSINVIFGKSNYYAPEKILDMRDSCLDYAKNLNNDYLEKADEKFKSLNEKYKIFKPEETLNNIKSAQQWHEGIQKSLDNLKPRVRQSAKDAGRLGFIKTSTIRSTDPDSEMDRDRDYSSIFISTQYAYTINDLVNWSYTDGKIEKKIAKIKDHNAFRNYDNSWFKKIMNLNNSQVFVLFIEDGACWEMGSYIKTKMEGKDSSEYCEGKPKYTDCMIKSSDDSKRLWGYCEDGDCKKCKNYGEVADAWQKCPDPDGPFSAENECMANYRCGEDANGARSAGMCKHNTK